LATAVTREYELILMLDPEVPDERREQITADTRQRIESGATLKHDTSWGMRKLAYEIEQRTEADYRLFRFEGQGGVLDDLNHTLRIADGVLRFRIFKVDPRAPSIAPPPPLPTPGAPPPRAGRRQEAAPASTEAAPSEPAATEGAAEAPAAEEPAATEPAAADEPSATTEPAATEEPAATAEPAAPAEEPAAPAEEPAAEEPPPPEAAPESERKPSE
jgi:ribosomal protein S6